MAVYTEHNTDMYSNAVGYIRVSDQSQVDGESLDNQRRAIDAYAAAKNPIITDYFIDEGKSGKNANRAGIQELLKHAVRPKNNIQFVVVYKMNRISRDLSSYFTQIHTLLAGRGIKIVSATEQIDDSPMGRFMENMLIINAQLDNDIKSSMTTDNMKALAMQGWWLLDLYLVMMLCVLRTVQENLDLHFSPIRPLGL